MDNRISASALARRLGDILSRVRYRGETFLVERHNTAIAVIGPAPQGSNASLRQAAAAWMSATRDTDFADDLERVIAADTVPVSPWDS